MKTKYLLILTLIIGAAFKAFGQDPHYSQFYASPLYTNPGFTGATEKNRVAANSRLQWVALGGSLNQYSFSFDHNAENLNSGFGLQVNSFSGGSSSYFLREAKLLYSYLIPVSMDWNIRSGLGFGFKEAGVDFSNMIFGDQIMKNGMRETREQLPGTTSTAFFDFSAGAVLYSSDKWLALSVNHLNKPSLSINGDYAPTPVAWGIQGGLNINLANPFYQSNYNDANKNIITPTFNFKFQGGFYQSDIGVYWNYEPFVAGVWYRGIPMLSGSVADAAVFLVGVKYNGFYFGYSYDTTLNSMTVTNTGGSHEISLSYEFGRQQPKGRKMRVNLPCPNF